MKWKAGVHDGKQKRSCEKNFEKKCDESRLHWTRVIVGCGVAVVLSFRSSHEAAILELTDLHSSFDVGKVSSAYNQFQDSRDRQTE